MTCETCQYRRQPLRAPRLGSDGAATGSGSTTSTGAVPEFFRSAHHFSQLAARARIRAPHRQRLRVWCCACRTGEDAYSAAMTLREAGCGGEVLATDTSADAIAAGRRGIYSLAAVEPLGQERTQRHFFVRGSEADTRVALVRGELRAMVRFARHDLRAPEWRGGEQFDFILCRDQLPELDRATQQRVLDRLAAALAPGGVLFLGESDPRGLDHPQLAPCGRTAYERLSAAG